MRRFTLLHLDGEAGLRGGERQLLGLAAALRARGHKNIVCARSGGELAAKAAGMGLEVMPLSLLNVVATARRENAIVHAHTAHTARTAVLAGLAGIKTVVHRRVDFPVSSLSASLKYGRAGKVVAVSHAIKDLLLKAGVPASRLTVVTDAIPVTDEEAKWTGLAATPFKPPTPEERTAHRQSLADEFNVDAKLAWIGNLAALVPHKDHDTLLAAAVIVLLKRPNTRFLIGGKGPEEPRLFESLKRMGLVGKVLLLGHREDPLPLLKALDLYCQSSWGEGMGSVLIEAQACGVPIAATTAGGIPEVVEDGLTGLLVKPRDPEALAAALLRLADDAALRRELADAARERLPRFGLKAQAAAMEEVYASLA